MKKILFVFAFCIAAMAVHAQEYVDMGLPSGTKWKTQNEVHEDDAKNSYFTFKEASSLFGESMPSNYQWEELKALCKWEWTGKGYKITGPNGNTIDLPAEGMLNCDKEKEQVGEYGMYWSYSLYDSFFMSAIRFSVKGAGSFGSKCAGVSVRLVKD